MSRALALMAVVSTLTTFTTACANSTKLVATWTDPNAQRVELTRTLAVFMSKEPAMRRMVEEQLAARLPGGVPSHTVIPDDQLSRPEVLRQQLAAGGYDGAVVMRLVGVTTDVVGSDRRDFYGYWGYWGSAYDPVYYSTEKLYSVESTLYTFREGKMVWMGRSETVDPKNANKLAEYSVNFVINNLKKTGFIR